MKIFFNLKQLWISRLTLVVLVLIIHLPFLDQAYHIDDRIYLEVAKNIFEKPLYPYDFEALYEGFIAPDAASHSHLPFTAYYLSIVQLVSGLEDEWVNHLAFLLFPLLATLAFYELARMLLSFPFAAAALLATSTSFLTLSNTLMPEVPMLAVWILALVSGHHFLTNRKGRFSWPLCMASLLASSFMSLLTLFILLLLAADWYFQRREKIWKDEQLPRILLLFLAPFLLWFLWYIRAYFYYDRFVLINTFLHIGQRDPLSLVSLAEKLTSFGLHLGGTFVIPLAGWIVFTNRTSRKIYIGLFFLSFIPAYLWHPHWLWIQAFIFSLFLTTGLLTLVTLAQTTPVIFLWKSKPKHLSKKLYKKWLNNAQEWNSIAILRVLFLWFWGMFLANLLVFYNGSVRYSILALPPFLLLFQFLLENRTNNVKAAVKLVVILALTLPYSFLVALSDYQFAESYRKECSRLVREFKRPDNQIWYTGEWGFRYYMDQLGARSLTQTGTDPEPGDIIVKPYVSLPWVTLYDSEEFVSLVEQRHIENRSPFRILDFHSSAGFYSTAWGILPISFTPKKRWEWFNIFQVKKKYDGPIPLSKRPW